MRSEMERMPASASSVRVSQLHEYEDAHTICEDFFPARIYENLDNFYQPFRKIVS